jgi:hypothetical protein
MKKLLLLLVSIISCSMAVAQVMMTEPVPKYGCPNVTHDVTIGVKNTSGFNIPAGFSYSVTVTVKNDVGAVIKTNTQNFSQAVANGDTLFVTIPNIPFQGAMTCPVDISLNYTFPSPGSYNTSGTYDVQLPPDLTIQENPVGTLEVVSPTLDSTYSVRYYKNGNYSIVKSETLDGIYAPSSVGDYTAKLFEAVSHCKSANPSNTVTILVTGIVESKKIDVAVYPNPMAASVTISTGLSTPLSYELLDINGSVLRKADFTSVTNVNVESLKAGSYVLVIKENNERVASYQLVK